jgi:hypothetical protein
MRILVVIGLLSTLASCVSPRDDRAVAEAIGAFLSHYSAANFREACAGEGECERTLKTVFAMLGPVKAAQASAEDVLNYKTEYQHGQARERFAWKGGQLAHGSYTIEIEFGDLAVSQWKEFRKHLAAESTDAACAMTRIAGCREQLARVTAVLGKAEISPEEFAGEVSRNRQKPFPKSVRLATTSRFANGEAREKFEWEIDLERGLRIVSFSIDPAR